MSEVFKIRALDIWMYELKSLFVSAKQYFYDQKPLT